MKKFAFPLIAIILVFFLTSCKSPQDILTSKGSFVDYNQQAELENFSYCVTNAEISKTKIEDIHSKIKFPVNFEISDYVSEDSSYVYITISIENLTSEKHIIYINGLDICQEDDLLSGIDLMGFDKPQYPDDIHDYAKIKIDGKKVETFTLLFSVPDDLVDYALCLAVNPKGVDLSDDRAWKKVLFLRIE